MLRRKVKFSLILLCSLCFCFKMAGIGEAAPGATVISRGVEGAYGELPEIDGLTDLLLQEKINAVIRKTAEELQNDARGRINPDYSYKVVCNTQDFLSILLKVENGDNFTAARGINIYLPSGAEYAFNEIFYVSDDFFDALEQSLGWRPPPDTAFGLSKRGAVFFRQTDGAEQLVGYEKLFKWINVGRAGYYLESYRVTAAADGKLLRVRVGGFVLVFLETNRTSGYLWQIKNSGDSPVLQYVNSVYIMNNQKTAGNRVGAGGWDMLVIGVGAPGETYLEAEYKRPWESQAVKTIKIQIIGE